jgi:hypothetical protein
MKLTKTRLKEIIREEMLNEESINLDKHTRFILYYSIELALKKDIFVGKEESRAKELLKKLK